MKADIQITAFENQPSSVWYTPESSRWEIEKLNYLNDRFG